MRQLVQRALGIVISMAVVSTVFFCRQSIVRSSSGVGDSGRHNGRQSRRGSSGQRLH